MIPHTAFFFCGVIGKILILMFKVLVTTAADNILIFLRVCTLETAWLS